MIKQDKMRFFIVWLIHKQEISRINVLVIDTVRNHRKEPCTWRPCILETFCEEVRASVYCLYYATITKHSNLHCIDRLKFSWLKASLKFPTNINTNPDVQVFEVHLNRLICLTKSLTKCSGQNFLIGVEFSSDMFLLSKIRT